jgi:hypothetical protein
MEKVCRFLWVEKTAQNFLYIYMEKVCRFLWVEKTAQNFLYIYMEKVCRFLWVEKTAQNFLYIYGKSVQRTLREAAPRLRWLVLCAAYSSRSRSRVYAERGECDRAPPRYNGSRKQARIDICPISAKTL